MTHKLPQLPYGFSALEPHIDTRTMAIHHDKHHQAYVDNLNKALEGHEDLQNMTVAELLRNLDEIPAEIRTAVRNNGGGHANHSMFWPSLSPKESELKGTLAEDIDEAFGSFENFKEQFTKAALTRFGSGWTWLCVDSDGGLVVTSTPNQDNPISTGLIPILGLDVWEHAYYLKYENRRGDYVAAWWNIVNWTEVSSNYASVRLAAGFDQVSQWAKSTWNKLEEGWTNLGKNE